MLRSLTSTISFLLIVSLLSPATCLVHRSAMSVSALESQLARLSAQVEVIRSALAASPPRGASTPGLETGSADILSPDWDWLGQPQVHPRPGVRFGEHCLTNGVLARYARPILVPSFGTDGQAALQNRSVLVVGVEALVHLLPYTWERLVSAPLGLWMGTALTSAICIVRSPIPSLGSAS